MSCVHKMVCNVECGVDLCGGLYAKCVWNRVFGAKFGLGCGELSLCAVLFDFVTVSFLASAP